MISIVKYDELTKDQRCLQNDLITKEFGHIPIVANTKWAGPDWTVMRYQNDGIVSFYNVIAREIHIDDMPVEAIGINNVITPPEYRGHGFAFDLLISTQIEMLDKLKAEVGLLLCADQMIPFYARLGWYKVDCPVYFEQDGKQNLWLANAMLLSRADDYLSPAFINLNGLPW
jgi:predicted acetyltransferase